MKQQAIIKYRSYVPHNWFAVTFCHVEFYGDDAEQNKQLWRKVEFEDYYEREEKCVEIRKGISVLEKELKDMEWYQMFNRWDKMDEIAIENKRLKEAEGKRFKETYKLISDAKILVRKLGFSLKSISTTGGACETVTEIYEK